MNETSKTNSYRDKKFFDTYLSGKVIDIGAGDDPVTSESEIFDLAEGNAEKISKYIQRNDYDCVYSSHCLEHIDDVNMATNNWWQLVKPGGYMIIVVPEETLYEQRIWPSLFAPPPIGHQHSFRLNSETSWSPVSIDILDLVKKLPNVKVISSQIHDNNYDYSIIGKRIGAFGQKIYKWRRSKNFFKRKISETLYDFLHDYFWVNSKRKSGRPIDQTTWNALAQIEVIIQKIK